MHCVLWTYRVPPTMTKDAIEAGFGKVAERYLDVPGLIRKYFGFSEDGASVIGVYLWRSKADADAFYTPEWLAGVRERWGATPDKTEYAVPIVAETTQGRVVRG